ncbi:MAG: phosphate propanoyltransferase [Oscillospiraceae bacterium]
MDNIVVETSARHCHLTREAIDTLFGKGYKLTPKKDLSQPGQYICEERVEIVGPKRSLAGVGIIGPERSDIQVELSLTDARTIGVSAPVRLSGDIKGSAGCKIVGPAGELEIQEGVLAAQRHIHFDTASAEKFGVKDGEIVSAKIATNGRSLTFDDVVCRVGEKHHLAMHIDTDESNAAGCGKDTTLELVR